MIFQSYFKLFIPILFVVFSISKSRAQHQNREHSQNQKIEQLLIEKRKINLSLAIENAYKIQIFNGSNELAKRQLNMFKQEFTAIDAILVFNSPNYKVWVGNFKNRLDAERNLIEIKKKFSNALLIKPSR
jgi:hypothetical protein